MDTKFGDFIVHWSIAALKIFKGNLLKNFVLIAVLVKVALEITKSSVFGLPETHKGLKLSFNAREYSLLPYLETLVNDIHFQ